MAGRYRVLELIGRGGMADVFSVHDAVTGTVLAMKRLRPVEGDEKHARIIKLFEREFHTLVAAGASARGRRSTTTASTGGPVLHDGAARWRRPAASARRSSGALSCAIARDVCSALSLLHSRRMVHRDMSPRNVRCTRDGHAKLIDFGAMAPMGVCKQVVGTPAFCAPEVLHLQPLDARTDLYSLGATLYSCSPVAARYPARDFRQLREAWGKTPRPPSEFAPRHSARAGCAGARPAAPRPGGASGKRGRGDGASGRDRGVTAERRARGVAPRTLRRRPCSARDRATGARPQEARSARRAAMAARY